MARKLPEEMKAYQFKPGESGNPGGKPAGLLTKGQVEQVFQGFHNKNRAELQSVVDNPKSTILQIMVASIMIKAIKNGDFMRADFLLNRAVGKVKDEIDLSGRIGVDSEYGPWKLKKREESE